MSNLDTTPTAIDSPDATYTFVQKVIGSDTYMVMADTAVHLEDEFSNLYYTTNSVANVALQPPYEPKVLSHLVSHNNILNQCIEAMEVNIDGTGHEFVPVDADQKPAEDERRVVTDFFNEPYPGVSFLQLRRKLRRDLESVGYGFLEVLETISGEVAALRNLDSYSIRFVKLDNPVQVKKTVTRNGKDQVIQLYERERRFMQKVGNSTVYFREFGTSRNLHRETGVWETEADQVPAEKRATSLIVFGVNPDTRGPYSVPRWINQMPSVVGSRKAEEQNLEFFDAGGMPPAIIFIQGGVLATSAANQLQTYLSGKNKNRHRAVVVEAQSSSGSLESAGTVQVKVERFGADKANDAMFANYDKNAEEHVRIGFRLPPLFIGRSQDYSFATAVVSYMIAEEQVFKPERLEFDAKITSTILKALGIKTLKFKSHPITLKTVEDKLKVLALLADKVEGEDFVAELNNIGGTELKYKEPPPPPADTSTSQTQPTDQPEGQPAGQPADQLGKEASGKVIPPEVEQPRDKKQPLRLVKMAHEWGVMKGLLVSKSDTTDYEAAEIEAYVASLKGADLELFNELVSAYTFGGVSRDLVSITKDCCSHH